MSEYLERIKNIITDNEQRPILENHESRVILAGPGSGKTYLLTTKVAQLLKEKLVFSPRKVACLTYSRMLESQLKESLQLLGVLDDERIFVGTVHSFCISEVILPFKNLYQLDLPDPLRIASWDEMLSALIMALSRQQISAPSDENDLEDLMRDLDKYRKWNIDTDEKPFLDCSDYSRKILDTLDWRQLSTDYLDILKHTDASSIDFVQLEIISLGLIRDHELVQKALVAKFPWWVIDEYQDLGKPFHEMVQCLFDTNKIQVIAIGDTDQCIYEDIQGSKPEYILELANKIQNQSQLKTNYRCTQEIIDLSAILLGKDNEYLSHDDTHVGKCYAIRLPQIGYYGWPSADDQQMVIQKILNSLTNSENGPKLLPEQIALLSPYRKGQRNLNAISERLDYSDWPHSLDKDPDYNDRKVKLIEWIELLASWCANKMPVGKPYISDLLPVWYELNQQHYGIQKVTENILFEREFVNALWKLRDSQMNLKTWFGQLTRDLHLDVLVESYENIRPDDANEYKNLCNQIDNNERFLTWDIARFGKIGSRTQLTTVHSSKGTQFEALIIAGFDRLVFWKRENIPLPLDHRLAYVGVTRAKTYLFLLYSKRSGYFVDKLLNSSFDQINYLKYDPGTNRISADT